MTQTGKSRRLTKKQIQILALIWIGVVVVVGVCVFVGILIALGRSAADGGSLLSGGGNVTPTVTAQSDQPTPTLDPALVAATQAAGPTSLPQPTIPPRQDPSFGYGIQAQIHMNTDQTLDQVEQLGLGWVKQQIRWADLEPAQGQANWDALDTIFSAAAARNLKVLISIVDAPDWARSVKEQAGPPDDPQHYVNYVSQLVQRYPGAVHAVEIWNEENLQREWRTGRALSAQEYVNLLRPTAEAIHQIDPGVIVISGALTPTGVNDYVLAVDDFVYMQDLINAGMLDYVDCVGAHANGINLPPDISAEDAFTGGPPPGTVFMGPYDTTNPLNPHHSWSFYSTLTGYHNLIVAAGKNTPLCVTEFGWGSVEGMNGSPREGFEFAFDNSLQDQATNIVRAFQLMNEWDFVWIAILFNLDFSPKAGGNTQDDATLFSIVHPDGSPRPAFNAVRDMPKPP